MAENGPERGGASAASSRASGTSSSDALSDLREGVHDARRIPMIVGGALLAGVAAVRGFQGRSRHFTDR